MSSTIPCYSNLALGDVVNPETTQTLIAIAEAEAPVEAAHVYLNALLASQKSIMTTRAELFYLNAPVESLDNAFQVLLPKIEAAGTVYAEERIAAEKELNDLRVKLGSTRFSIESPVNLAKSHAKIMPLASDSLSLDVEYFALDADRKDMSFYLNNINLLVRSSVSRLGPNVWSQIAEPIQRAVAHRLETHNVAGTLVICASCTHKSSCVLAPLVLDVDKAMHVWNSLFPEDPCDARAMQHLADGSPEAVQNKFSIVAGMRFGSIFVGMVHLIHEKTGSTRRLDVTIPLPSRQEERQPVPPRSSAFIPQGHLTPERQFELRRPLRTDPPTEDATLVGNTNRLLSKQQPFSDINVVSLGVIPSVSPKESKSGPSSRNDAERRDVPADCYGVNGLGSIRGRLEEKVQGAEQLPGMDSLMAALDDYLAKAANGNSGIPISYDLKDITKSHLARLWAAKQRNDHDPNIF